MTDHQPGLIARREILSAYLKVLEHPEDLLRVCASLEGDDEALRSAISKAFGVSEIAAHAITAMQVRRFTPSEIAKVQWELAEVERALDAEGP